MRKTEAILNNIINYFEDDYRNKVDFFGKTMNFYLLLIKI